MDKKNKIACRMQHIQPFYVMDILSRAKQLEALGHDVIHLEVGEPDFPTPEKVKLAAFDAIKSDATGYTAASGIIELKDKIAGYYQQRLSTGVNSRNIVITPGASGALQLALSVLVNPSQKVLMADPGYPCNRHFVRLLEGRAVSIAVDDSTGYQLTRELIEKNWDNNTVAALISSPSNPTGTLVDQEEMQKIIQVVKQHNGILLVDEIYQGLVYEQKDFTAAALSSDVFVINSFSKLFSMTGWRLGWMIVPDEYLEPVTRLAQNLFLSAPTISQYAALAAFDKETLHLLDERRNELKNRRDFLLKGLAALGFKIDRVPGGAFYIYANIQGFSNDSFIFCKQLLENNYVAITPGIDFGQHRANQFVRFAYTQNIETLQRALERIRQFVS